MNTMIKILRNRYGKDLPENLESGAVLISEQGVVAKVVRTAKKNQLDERLYRTRYIYKFASGRVYEMKTNQPVIERDRKGNPIIIGFGWTRDQLAQMGCKYIRKADVPESQILDYLPLFGD